MGDAAVSALVKEVVGRLTSLAIQELGLLRGLKDDLLRLKDDFDQIQAVLEDANEKYIKDKAVELWLRRLRSASLMVENVLDEASTEALLQRIHKERVAYKVRAFFSPARNQLMSHVRIAHKVKDIRRKLDDIASKRFELNLNPSGATSHVDDMRVVDEMPDRETSSHIHSSVIFGRDEEMEMVTDKICNKDVGKHASGEIRVYGIWGMGGLGKTTLAQLVYNHERVNQCFEFKCWVYVSENFQVKEIIKKIIESVDKCECKLTQLDTLQGSLKDKLRGKRFLVVLDDVWIEEDEKAKWEELTNTLNYGAEGSTVMLTTRSSTTSRMMAKVPELQHKLGCLSDDDAWLLFKMFAFVEGREGDDMSELEPIGREIVDNCKGLPLAVKTLGSLMWSKRSRSDWQRVKCSFIWELRESKVLPALKLSYDNLLPHIKRCFAYCCLFPKGYAMEKDVVIQLWVVNDFIPPRGEIDLHVIGEEIFNCLVWRSFFHAVKSDQYQDERYKMHDLMHDMAQHIMRHDCLVIEPAYKEAKVPNEVLHLSSRRPDFILSPQDLRNLASLRSILVLGQFNYGSQISQIFNHVYLRVLYLTHIELKTLPESICKLNHLRYLNLSESSIIGLPESIIYLQNLQVLILYCCRKLCKLPQGIRYMRSLQRLEVSHCNSLLHLPSGIKDLTNLRILSRFPVGKKSGAKIEELRDLNLLEGELNLLGLENVGGLSEAKSAKLNCKINLLCLGLSWSSIFLRDSKPGVLVYDEEVLEGLEPNPHLRILKIFDYMGKIISPSWMLNLSNLVEITFSECRIIKHIPPLGRLPNLKVIHLWDMDSLKGFHYDDTNMLRDTSNMFLSLQELYISYCPNLVSLPDNFLELTILRLHTCNELVSLPGSLPKLEVLKLINSKEVVSLPSNLPNIIKLVLRYCDGLLSLPDEIQSFKDLKELEINDCKHLGKMYEEDIGVDWPKISHIPNIRIYT